MSVNLRAYRRFVVVAWQFLPLLVAYARDRRRFLLFGKSRSVSAEQRRKRATKLLDSLITLGPTFIKLGQLLSTRPDILPPEYLSEFSRLQDDVPPADWAEAERVIEAELGPVDEQFDEFDTESISGASLGQVYVARLDDEPVAVKVRRPDVEELVEADLRVIRWSLPLLMRFVDEARSFSLETLADEFAKTIREEMDYEREAEMLTEIRENFSDDENVRIPDTIESHSTGRVLTMEYVNGTKISDLDQLDDKGLDRSELAERLQRTYLQMIIDDGVFHADPHPGNLAVADDGTLVFYDFGMSGYVDPFVQDRIVDFYGAVARRDIDAILDSLIEIGTLSPEADRQLMAEVAEIAIQDASGEEVEQYRVQQIVQQLEDTIYEFPLRLPPNLALVLRVATVVEGVCVTLDPEFDFISVATTYLGEQGYIEEGVREYISDQGEQLRESTTAAVRIPPKLESALDRIERDSVRVTAELDDDRNYFDLLAKRIVLGLLMTATVVSGTLLYVAEAFLLSGGFGAVTLAVGVVLYRSFTKSRTLRGKPQFTRQRMRQREEERDEDAMGPASLGVPSTESESVDSPILDGTEE
ncbi:Predicted unusual protein kinase regulating ubiquinone biosynthesis, AarF/ABC1/UbiB family [Halovenus aranensis]|uniref:Predicted unusual protein kinase regulating ubiquinone biosynthesis, AarF/ABC1/UbiB family n=1 Tax=Halovenus aranensis TaxID=890420 RepID=A0A1G8YSK1_9EURY|nr:Predicted unusual protein kinase regulating ubiquinone biosynthesis, AarF/ABC1/UbiB family [Halovenus aranensis]